MDKNKNKAIQGMVYNKATLAFPEKSEVLFLQKYFSDSILQIRLGLLSAILLYAAFGYLDTLLIPKYTEIFHIIRYYVVVPIALLVLIASFTSFFSKVWDLLLLFTVILGGVGINIMTMLVPDNYSYYAGIMLVFSAGYFLLKLRFFYASIAGWTILIFFNVGAVLYTHASPLVLISYNFFFISANIIGMIAAYNIEYFVRRDFYMNQELDRQKEAVEDVNKNLERIVEERTKELLVAKNKAEQSDRLKSAFLANMSHEIRTPMNGVLGFADLLKRPELSGENQLKYIEIIENSGKRMLNIINDIINISKIESGIIELNISVSNINEQIQYIYTFFKPEAEQKGIGLVFQNSLSNNHAFVKTDREKIFAILTNLVKNAMKFTSIGSINFGYELKNNFLEFFVKDTGMGINEEQKEIIFERFRQGSESLSRNYEGSGLGLSISKAYVKMLGGNIWVESEVDKGSTFYFTIPYDNEDVLGKINNEIVHIIHDEKKINKKKILIVEDDEASEMLLTIVLSEYKKEILKAKTGIEAVQACLNNPDIELVLMDIQLPGINGYEATRQIRQFNKDVIIIAQTAFGLAGDRGKALESGCNDYISKPIEPQMFKSIIQKHFD